MIKMIKTFFVAAIVCTVVCVCVAQTLNTAGRSLRTAEEGLGDEEFRRGVQSYYRGAFNDSIMRFERALSYNKTNNVIMDWLGKAYYRSGVEGAALELWQSAYDSGYGGPLLLNRMDVVRERRITGANQETAMRYTESGVFSGAGDGHLVFSQPVSVLPNPDGTAWVLSYGSNDLLLFDINGTAINRAAGPLNGLDRPVDIIRMADGKLLVTESAGDRMSVFDEKGVFIKHIGTKGRGEGQMIGPQYASQDSFGNIYVTDFGNRRVDVFDSEGNFLLYFGNKSDDFSGLLEPTGVALYNDRVFVADSASGGVYEFDRSGNYVGLLVEEKTFKHPEAMKTWEDRLLICDSNKVMSINTNNGATFENVSTGNAPTRVTTAVPDINGNILVTDIVSNEMHIMSKMTEVIGGLFVQIESVNAESFPDITVDLSVENRHRQPVVGLREVNFFVSEGKNPVENLQLAGSAYKNTAADITLVLDRSYETQERKDALESAVKEVAASMKGQGTLRIVSAGTAPVTEYSGSPAAVDNFSVSALKTPVSRDAAIDLAVRLAVNDLIHGEKKKAVVFITASNTNANAFKKYALSDLASYLNNNSVVFSAINLAQRAVGDEIAYLCTSTQGKEYFVYRPEGLSSVVSDIIAKPSGLYQLKYRSALATNFGTSYLPLEAEVYLLNRSGRDETGYFAPLQ